MSPLPARLLGGILIERGAINQEQLEVALEAQKKTGEFLGITLIRLKILTEKQLIHALSVQFGMPVVDFESERVDFNVAEGFSIVLLRKHQCLPFHEAFGVISVAISNPLDAWAISDFQVRARGRKMKFVLATPGQIESALNLLHRKTLSKLGEALTDPIAGGSDDQ